MDFSGFLFGNINEEGELEDDRLLDKVFLYVLNSHSPIDNFCRLLAGLSHLGIS